MLSHISQRVCLNVKVYEFETKEEFNIFRMQNFLNFKQIKGSKITKTGYSMTYYCADYFNKPSQAKLRCPSYSKFIKSNIKKCSGKLTALYCHDGSVKCSLYPCTNTNHIMRKKLSESEINYIIEKLKCGMSFTQIRSAFVKDFSRNLSRYDVNNLKYRNKISFEFRTNRNDLISTRNILNLLKKQHHIYSNVDSIQEIDNLIIVIQFIHQKSIVEHSAGILCIDSTHGLSKYLKPILKFLKKLRYNFKLTTIVGISKEGNGFPLIYMISKRETENEINILFENFCNWNKINVNIIMTDDFLPYSKLIPKFFPNSNHILCIWHVYRAWKRKCDKIYGKVASGQIFQGLMKIQRILDKNEFEKQLENFIENSCEKMKKYLVDNYQGRTYKWAACYRQFMQINVNMYIESMHRLLKRTYLKGNITLN